ncbi:MULTISPECIES: LysE family translocator [Rhodopseudomonas]|uniref:Lysine exporter protein (LYSE/YGGA) n=1 Tax=Rhodopseudomonas palustris (strain DX-1) TaxID=652103 RepID=E6VCX8_RHOPX|nr:MULTISPECIES: LysE family translocator [Rhodopseudomonas]NEW85783.1 LysE family translocator [Rhodopseudomonas sp. WA056]
MATELLAAFIGFAFATLFTPGPNNIMLLSSGLTFGFRRTLPHVAGVTIGFAVMVAAMGFGFGAVFAAYPLLQIILKYAGAAYLIWLAGVIALARPADPDATVERRPMSFWGAAAFQWVNVKGWVIAIGTVTAYSAVAPYPWNVAVQATTLLAIGTASSAAWALFGTALQSLVKSPQAVRVFNLVMAALLVASLYPVLRQP